MQSRCNLHTFPRPKGLKIINPTVLLEICPTNKTGDYSVNRVKKPVLSYFFKVNGLRPQKGNFVRIFGLNPFNVLNGASFPYSFKRLMWEK